MCVCACACACVVIVCTFFITLYNVWPEEGCCSFTIFAANISLVFMRYIFTVSKFLRTSLVKIM